MLRLAADENLNNAIVRGLRRLSADIDIVRVQDIGLSGADDPTVLAWAASESRVLLTHDLATVTAFAYARVREGLPMPGVFEINDNASIGRVLDELMLLVFCSHDGEWENQVRYLPLP